MRRRHQRRTMMKWKCHIICTTYINMKLAIRRAVCRRETATVQNFKKIGLAVSVTRGLSTTIRPTWAGYSRCQHSAFLSARRTQFTWMSPTRRWLRHSYAAHNTIFNSIDDAQRLFAYGFSNQHLQLLFSGGTNVTATPQWHTQKERERVREWINEWDECDTSDMIFPVRFHFNTSRCGSQHNTQQPARYRPPHSLHAYNALCYDCDYCDYPAIRHRYCGTLVNTMENFPHQNTILESNHIKI